MNKNTIKETLSIFNESTYPLNSAIYDNTSSEGKGRFQSTEIQIRTTEDANVSVAIHAEDNLFLMELNWNQLREIAKQFEEAANIAEFG